MVVARWLVSGGEGKAGKVQLGGFGGSNSLPFTPVLGQTRTLFWRLSRGRGPGLHGASNSHQGGSLAASHSNSPTKFLGRPETHHPNAPACEKSYAYLFMYA